MSSTYAAKEARAQLACVVSGLQMQDRHVEIASSQGAMSPDKEHAPKAAHPAGRGCLHPASAHAGILAWAKKQTTFDNVGESLGLVHGSSRTVCTQVQKQNICKHHKKQSMRTADSDAAKCVIQQRMPVAHASGTFSKTKRMFTRMAISHQLRHHHHHQQPQHHHHQKQQSSIVVNVNTIATAVIIVVFITALIFASSFSTSSAASTSRSLSRPSLLNLLSSSPLVAIEARATGQSQQQRCHQGCQRQLPLAALTPPVRTHSITFCSKGHAPLHDVHDEEQGDGGCDDICRHHHHHHRHHRHDGHRSCDRDGGLDLHRYSLCCRARKTAR